MEIRCRGKRHALLVDGLVEVKCDSRVCGAGPGRVVLHRFNPGTGDLVETRRYRDVAASPRTEGGT